MILLLRTRLKILIACYWKKNKNKIIFFLLPIIHNKNKASRTWFEYAEDITQHTGVFVYNNKESIAFGCVVVLLVVIFASVKSSSEDSGDFGSFFSPGYDVVLQRPLEEAGLIFKLAGSGAASLMLVWNFGWDDVPELRDLVLNEVSILENLGNILIDKYPDLRVDFCKENLKVDFKFLGECSGILDNRRPSSSRRVIAVLENLLSKTGNITFKEIKVAVQHLTLKEQQQVLTFHKLISILAELSRR